MKIQELEQIVGMERAVIRFYEKQGLIKPERQENGYREYSMEIADELKKIRLLRQLGVRIATIRSLQQGGEDFQQVLAQQIHSLTDQIAEQKRTKALCEVLQNDRVQYDNLDADHYWQVFRDVSIDERGSVSPAFHETIPEEIHPWRRCFARTFDYFLLSVLVHFIMIVVLRVRPLPGNLINTLITVLSCAIFIPIEALLLSLFGTTPGKFICGIHIDAAQGGRLSFSRALQRAKTVYVKGMFLCIPYLECYSLLRCYCALTGRAFYRFAKHNEIDAPKEMSWDEECEISYHSWEWRRGVALVVMIASAISLLWVTAVDSIYPKYRGNELTIAQFSENYNNCLHFFQEEVQIYDKLQPDGTKYPVPDYEFVLDMSSGDQFAPLNYRYTTNGDILTAVVIQNKWENVYLLCPVDLVAAPSVALLLARNEISYTEVQEFLYELDSQKGDEEAVIVFQDILKVEWKIEAENCEASDGAYFGLQEGGSTLDFICTITILE